MALDVRVETVIDCPLEVVAAYAGDPTNAPKWYRNIESVRWRSEPPIAVGSQLDFVAHFLGRRLAYTYEVVELVPGHRLVMRTQAGPFPMETTYEFSSIAAHATHMSLRNRGEPAGFSRLGAPAMSAAVRRTTQQDLRRLKALLEGHRPR